MSRTRLYALASVIAACGLLAVWLLTSRTASTPKPAAAPAAAAKPAEADNLVKVSPEQIEAAKITVIHAAAGTLTRVLSAPAAISTDPDRVARVATKVAGSVFEMRKKLGDRVALGEVVAVLESREVADAKSEYLAAVVNHDLQSKLFAREKGLFEKKITAEQLFLKAKTTFTEARLRLDLARQKLAALDLADTEIAALPSQPLPSLRRKDIRAPLAGRIIERLAVLGQPVGGEGQTKELYVISDLSQVEAELAVPAADLPLVREGQTVTLKNSDGKDFTGSIVYVNAMITRETRSGQVMASIPNPQFALRPGSLLQAEIALNAAPARVKIPRAAVLSIDNETCVFVRTRDGFVRRKVELGASDGDSVEIISGLSPGETIAAANVFILKAELIKGTIPEE